LKKKSITKSLDDRILTINWKAVRHNIQYFREKLKPKTKLMLMIKADAYGNGAVSFAQLIEEENQADYLSVAYPEEGVELRKNGISLPIMVLNPPAESWEIMVKHCLEPEIHHLENLKSFHEFLNSQHKELRGYPIHLKFNSGMNRLGINQEEVPELVSYLKQVFLPFKIKSLMSHLSCSDSVYEDEFTKNQLKLFQKICRKLKPYLKHKPFKHILNTNGIERYSEFQMEMVRLGIGIHGASKLQNLRQTLLPTTVLKSRICAVRRVKAGDSIGYGRAGKVQSEGFIATLPIGYADGVSRWLGKGNWQVEIEGRLFPTIGNVCMDLCMIDLGENKLPINTEVIIFGGKKSLFEFALAQYTITYEALTRIGKRVKRVIVNR